MTSSSMLLIVGEAGRPGKKQRFRIVGRPFFHRRNGQELGKSVSVGELDWVSDRFLLRIH